ncbi:ATP-dependent peptidase [Forsythia ovata]|uniref:ATP-dependent peptidase n=1 Tax=Forsythia ovata TaxID=205694 RepID=A0ABD1TUN6_9LAMI
MQLQAPDMRAFRAIYFRKHHSTLSSLNPNPLITCKSPNYPPLPRKFHSTPTTTTTNETAATSWTTAYPNPPPSDSASPNTSTVQAIYDPVAGRVVTKWEPNNKKEEPDPGVEKSRSSSNIDQGNRIYGDVIGSSSVSRSIRKKGKSRSVFVCEDCGYSDGQWWGTCKQCQKVGTMRRFTEGVQKKMSGFEASENALRSWLPQHVAASAPIRLTDVNSQINESSWRITLPGIFGAEVERVLGGGLVPGSLVLVGGDPGVGKSTLLLQIAALISEGNDTEDSARVIYVSGEESVEQIGNRADRLRIETEDLFLYSSTDIEDILKQARVLSPRALVIDSIQTVYLREATGNAGSHVQVKECTSALLRFAKKTNIPVLLTGHVTKDGEIAGPRVLEHIVDVVLYMEGEKYSSHRLLRSVKNRFGSTDELGVFQMSQSGLEGVSNPSGMFLSEQHSDSDYLAGLAIAVMMDGSRAFVIEIQALCVAGSSAPRHVNGVPGSRADMIISVIVKQAGLKLQENGIFLNVVSGVHLTETAGDLAIAAAICSSFLEFPIPMGIAFIAEVGLGGELRTVPQLEKRINTLAKLGYKKCIVPKSAEKTFYEMQSEGMEILGCNNLKEMIHTVFRRG